MIYNWGKSQTRFGQLQMPRRGRLRLCPGTAFALERRRGGRGRRMGHSRLNKFALFLSSFF